MDKIKKIVVPLDFSSATDALIGKATYLSKKFEAELILVHAIEHHPSPTHPFPVEAERQLKSKIYEHLDKQATKLRNNGAKVAESAVCRYGKAVKVILSTARRHGANIILMGARQKSAIQRFIGGTAEKTARKSHIPILLVHPEDPKENFKHILCAYDFSPHSKKALQVALHIGFNTGAELTVSNIAEVLNVPMNYPHLPIEGPVVPFGTYVEDYSEWEKSTHETNTADYLAHRHNKVCNAIAEVNSYEYPAKIDILQGHVTDRLLEQIKKHSSDLLVMGATGHNNFLHIILGSTAERLLRKAPCSILVIKDHDIFIDNEDND